MPTRNVNLTEHLDQFIESGITSGRFSNASEVVREGLRLLEQREEEDKAKLEWLRAAAKKGFDAADGGEYTILRSREELHSFMMDIHQQVALNLPLSAKVPNGHRPAVHLTDEAKQDITEIVEWSFNSFGEAAALRYSALIEQAIDDLFFSRNRVSGVGVKEPRHFLLYRRREDGVVEIGRIFMTPAIFSATCTMPTCHRNRCSPDSQPPPRRLTASNPHSCYVGM